MMQPKAKAVARKKYQDEISEAAVCKTDEELKLPPLANRTRIEFCCGQNSKLGQPRIASEGCDVIRITEDFDMTVEDNVVHLENQIALIDGLILQFFLKELTSVLRDYPF